MTKQEEQHPKICMLEDIFEINKKEVYKTSNVKEKIIFRISYKIYFYGKIFKILSNALI